MSSSAQPRSLCVCALLLIALAGCAEPTPISPAQNQPPPPPPPPHARVGPHGGALLPLGANHVELTYDAAQARLIADFYGADATSAQPVSASALSAQIKLNGGAFQSVAFTALPQNGESAARASRFAGAALHLTSDFEIVLRLRDGENVWRTQALLDPGAIATTRYVCPMHSGKTYAAPGTCPLCGMTLIEEKNGAQAHADHRPRHGGVFFMSADNWHHLEGVFAPPNEFRLYFYNNFTRPMDPSGFDAAAEFTRKNPHDAPLAISLKPGTGNAYLSATIPPDCAVPPTVAVRMKFAAEQPGELFNFSFSDSPSPPAR